MGKIAGIFPIGETGEQFVVAEWYPDPEVVEQELFRLANDIEDWGVPLTEARQAFIHDTRMHFQNEMDPYGRPWQALSDGYLKDKLALGFPDRILERDDTLRQAAISESAWLITEREVIFRVDELPFYGPYHQSGVTSGYGIKTKTLPQRMFIGASEDAINTVEGIFIRYINAMVDKDIDDGPVHFPGISSNIHGPSQIINVLKTGQPQIAGGRFGRKR
jgi:hypothetical protein